MVVEVTVQLVLVCACLLVSVRKFVEWTSSTVFDRLHWYLVCMVNIWCCYLDLMFYSTWKKKPVNWSETFLKLDKSSKGFVLKTETFCMLISQRKSFLCNFWIVFRRLTSTTNCLAGFGNILITVLLQNCLFDQTKFSMHDEFKLNFCILPAMSYQLHATKVTAAWFWKNGLSFREVFFNSKSQISCCQYDNFE